MNVIRGYYTLRLASEAGVNSWAWAKSRQISTSSVACFRYDLPMFLIYLLNEYASWLGVLRVIDGGSKSESMTQGRMDVQTKANSNRRVNTEKPIRICSTRVHAECVRHTVVGLRGHQSLYGVFLPIRENILMTRVDELCLT